MMTIPFRNINQQISYREAKLSDRNDLANLIHFETYVHRHLDWKAPLDWVGFNPFLVAEQRNEIISVLACPADPPAVAWIRLFAVTHQLSIKETWQAMWSRVQVELQRIPNIRWSAAITLQPWFEALLEQSQFEIANRVVMLNWEADTHFPEIKSTEAILRPMNPDDLPEVEDIDCEAFNVLWQNSQESLALALRQAAFASVAEMDRRMVAYQISTASPMGGHLARLAVRPGFQAQGIGSMLMRDLLSWFTRRGTQRVTVNTQIDNAASLYLYQKFGFYLTGEEYPVYQYRLDS